MRRFLPAFIPGVIFLFNVQYCKGQTSPGISIIVESKQIFSEKEMLKQAADEVYLSKLDWLKETTVSQLKKQIKQITDQNTRAEIVKPSINTTMTAIEKNGKIFLRYLIPKNTLEFKITTPDVLPGVGLGKSSDPVVDINYDIYADFPLQQSGTLESIKFTNPSWDVNITHWQEAGIKGLSINKEDLGMWIRVNWVSSIQSMYVGLNDITSKFNNYITSAINNNSQLKKEFDLDENRQLRVEIDNNNSNLAFVHNYSKMGIVKRSSSTNASTVSQPVKSVPQPAGTTTSAGGINKPNTATKPVPKVNTPVRRS